MKCSSSCWNLWGPVNAGSWEIQKCVMLGVLSSLAEVLARGIVPYTACVSPGSSSFPLHISVPSMSSQGDRAFLCLHQNQQPDPWEHHLAVHLQRWFDLHTSHSVQPNTCKNGCEFRVGKKEIRQRDRNTSVSC